MFWICNVLNSPLTMRMKGAKTQTGANISLYTVYHPFMLYIHIHCIIRQPDQTLNTSKCLYLLTTNFGQHVTIWNVIYLWMNFFWGDGGGWLGEWVLWMRMSVYSFKSLIAICHNMFVNCDAINVLDYQISLIEKKKIGCFELR